MTPSAPRPTRTPEPQQASGLPINEVSRWLSHASLQKTLIYLEILPDPTGYMERASQHHFLMER